MNEIFFTELCTWLIEAGLAGTAETDIRPLAQGRSPMTEGGEIDPTPAVQPPRARAGCLMGLATAIGIPLLILIVNLANPSCNSIEGGGCEIGFALVAGIAIGLVLGVIVAIGTAFAGCRGLR